MKTITAFTKDQAPSPVLALSSLETLSPITNGNFHDLLMKHPPGSWKTIWDFLVSHHLLLAPSASMIPTFVAAKDLTTERDVSSDTSQPAWKDPFAVATSVVSATSASSQKQKAAKASKVAEQVAAREKAKATKAKAHTARMADQKAAATKRAEARKRAHQSRLEAAASRKTRLTDSGLLKDAKSAQDVKLWLEATHKRQITAVGGNSKFVELLNSLPPVSFARTPNRCVRPILALPPNHGSDSAADLPSHYAAAQDAIRQAERHLYYLLHEDGQEGWSTVQPRRHKFRMPKATQAS